MDIQSLTSELRTKCEEAFYMLSADLDKETAEKLCKSVVKSNLETEKKLFEELLPCCEVGYEHGKQWRKKGSDFDKMYADGIKRAVDVRRNTYTKSIEKINNKLDILKLL